MNRMPNWFAEYERALAQTTRKDETALLARIEALEARVAVLEASERVTVWRDGPSEALVSKDHE